MNKEEFDENEVETWKEIAEENPTCKLAAYAAANNGHAGIEGKEEVLCKGCPDLKSDGSCYLDP